MSFNKKIIYIFLFFILIILFFQYYILSNQTTKIKINEIASENSTLTGFNYSYCNPIIPKGFKPVDSGAPWRKLLNKIANWNKGLVIEDEKGNQFVWVPVKNGNQPDGNYNNSSDIAYKKWYIYTEKYVGEYKIELENIYEDKLPKGIEKEEDQINKYGGFYIGRYETGINEQDFMNLYSLENGYENYTVDLRNNQSNSTPVIKKDAQLWNFIEYKNAKEVAEKFIATNEVKSGLMTGKQFDTILRWAVLSGYDIKDTKTWGNHLDTNNVYYGGRYISYLRGTETDWTTKEYGMKENGKIIITSPGGVKSAKMNEICDISGNMLEYTTDIVKNPESILAITRGGTAAYDGKNSKNITPNYNIAFQIHYVIGFRIVLYIT